MRVCNRKKERKRKKRKEGRREEGREGRRKGERKEGRNKEKNMHRVCRNGHKNEDNKKTVAICMLFICCFQNCC